MRILVVDDDYVSRTKLKALLMAYGDVDAVPNGELAYHMFKKAHEESVPYQLITMDIKMPGMSGKEVLQNIRKYERQYDCAHRDLAAKIIMVTVMRDQESIDSSFAEKCGGYLMKPVTPEKIRDELSKIQIKPMV